MNLSPQTSSGGWLLLMKNLLHSFAASFESPEKKAFKKLKRFIEG